MWKITVVEWWPHYSKAKPARFTIFWGNEIANLDLVKLILKKMAKPESLISFVTDRLGHDRRCAIDSAFAERELKWKPHKDFEQGLTETIKWYMDHQNWWQPLLERAGRY